jgi:hypothetical protein
MGGGVRPEFVYRLQKGKVFVYNCIKLQSTECTVHSYDGQYPNPISVLLYGKLTWQLLNTNTDETLNMYSMKEWRVSFYL